MAPELVQRWVLLSLQTIRGFSEDSGHQSRSMSCMRVRSDSTKTQQVTGLKSSI